MEANTGAVSRVVSLAILATTSGGRSFISETCCAQRLHHTWQISAGLVTGVQMHSVHLHMDSQQGMIVEYPCEDMLSVSARPSRFQGLFTSVATRGTVELVSGVESRTQRSRCRQTHTSIPHTLP